MDWQIDGKGDKIQGYLKHTKMERDMNQEVINARTLLDHAVKVERDGYRFYLHLAKAMSDKPRMDFFHLLAEDEQRHEQTFRNMALERSADQDSGQGQLDAALNGFLRDMDQYGAMQVERALRGEMDRDDMIQLAVQLEKDSIIYYSSLKAHAGKENLPLIETIIDEELRHLSRLFAFRQGELNTDLPSVDDI